MDAGISNVIYMELYSGPKMANGRCGKTIDTGTIDRGSSVLALTDALLVPAFLRWLLGFWKICAPLWYNVQGAQLFPWPQFISHSEPACDVVTHTNGIICGKNRCSV